MFFFNKNKKTSDKNAEAETRKKYEELEEKRRELFEQSLKEIGLA